jgi:hypothetical protein
VRVGEVDLDFSADGRAEPGAAGAFKGVNSHVRAAGGDEGLLGADVCVGAQVGVASLIGESGSSLRERQRTALVARVQQDDRGEFGGVGSGDERGAADLAGVSAVLRASWRACALIDVATGCPARSAARSAAVCSLAFSSASGVSTGSLPGRSTAPASATVPRKSVRRCIRPR